MDYEIIFLKSLLFTIIVETVILYILIRFIFHNRDTVIWLIVLSGVTASLATLPYLWFIVPLFVKTKLYYKVISEFLAIFIESFILLGFLRVKYHKALFISVVCNVISYIAGLIVNLF